MKVNMIFNNKMPFLCVCTLMSVYIRIVTFFQADCPLGKILLSTDVFAEETSKRLMCSALMHSCHSVCVWFHAVPTKGLECKCKASSTGPRVFEVYQYN